MKISSWLNICKLSKFEYGEQKVTQFILFECKYLFSIIFFYFHKSSGTQDRFHTHAFKALSIRLFGNYDEEFIDKGVGITCEPRDRKRFLYIPRGSYHRIARSTGCLTLLISGPWDKTWKEWKDNTETEYNWSRGLVDFTSLQQLERRLFYQKFMLNNVVSGCKIRTIDLYNTEMLIRKFKNRNGQDTGTGETTSGN